MNAVERILVPLDGSALSSRILVPLGPLVARPEARVTLVHVVAARRLEGDADSGRVLDQARTLLDRACEALRQDRVRVDSELLVGGDPATRIHDYAQSIRPSLVAMATHGRSGLSRWVRGSVAERVVRTSPFPVLLWKPFEGERGALGFRRILVPLDGSPHSGEILPLVRDVAGLFGAQVELLHVLDPDGHDGGGAPDAAPRLHEAQDWLEFMARGVPGARTRAVAGSPAAAIVDIVRDEAFDLVAMTTHGRSGLSRWAFGSVAEHVVRHGPCPLLVMRTRAPDDAGP